MAILTHDIWTGVPPHHLPARAGWFGRTVRLWRNRINEREALARLGDRDLRDLRLSHWEVEQELAKPFWRG